MLKAVLDTDTLSEIVKGRDLIVQRNAQDYLDEHGRFTLTSVSVFEVLYGLHVKMAARQIRDFKTSIRAHEELTPTADDYVLAAELCAALHRVGTPIGTADPLIAACAIARRLPLVTGNKRHYGFIQSVGFPLQLLNWRDETEQTSTSIIDEF